MKFESYLNAGTTIKELIYNVAEKFPDNDAFKFKKEGVIVSKTFQELQGEFEAIGTSMFAKGLRDCRIGLIGENSYSWFVTFLAAVCGGNVAVPFDKGLTARELENCITKSEIKAFFYDVKYQEMIDQVKPKVSKDIEYYCMTGEDTCLPAMIAEGENLLIEGQTDYFGTPVEEEDIAVFLFTSGTTSDSKIVMLSHKNIASNITDMLQMKLFYPEDVNMAFLPFHHSFGLVGCLVFLSSGCANVFCDGLKYVQKNFEEYGVSVFVGVPLIVENLYYKVMRQIEKQGKSKTVAKGLKISSALRKLGVDARRKIFAEIIEKLGGSLRLIVCGAAPLNADVARGLNGFGIVTIQGYGLTETSPVLCAERPWNLYAGSVGIPMKSVELRIDSPDENGIGEIVAKGPNVMVGYYNQPTETAEVIKGDWFYTGDLGKIDRKGNLWISGRKKNVIVLKNGKNVFPEEIEDLMCAVPYIDEVMIFTREKHNELVLWVKAVYNAEYAKSEGLTEADVAEKFAEDLGKINKDLPKYKHVNHFILSDEPMIKTTSQKIKRRMEIEKINANQDQEVCYNAVIK